MKGGWSSASSPFVLLATGMGMGEGLGLGDSEGEGDGDAEEDGEGLGVGVGGPCSANCAHGFGGTLAQMWWRPGGSPANGLTFTPLKLPFPSACAFPMTLVGVSQ